MPTQEEIDKKFNDTYVNDVREHHSITQQFSGVGMLPLNWTQTPAAMMPPNSIIDRRCNWDTYFVYAKNYYDYSKLYRLKHYATYVGLLPSHDVLVFEDFDQEIKHYLRWMINGAEPDRYITRYNEVIYCPNGHMDPNIHHCGWCDENTMREPQGSFIPGTALIRVSRNVHRYCWIEAEPPREPGTDESSGPSHSTSEEKKSDDLQGEIDGDSDRDDHFVEQRESKEDSAAGNTQ